MEVKLWESTYIYEMIAPALVSYMYQNVRENFPAFLNSCYKFYQFVIQLCPPKYFP